MQNRVSVDFIYWYPILEDVFHWLGLNDKVSRQLSYGEVVPELRLNEEDFSNCYTDILLVYPKSSNRNELCMI